MVDLEYKQIYKFKQRQYNMDQFLHDDVDIYLVHHENDHEDARRPSFSLEKTNDANFTCQGKIDKDGNKCLAKVKYADKLYKYASLHEEHDLNEADEGCSLHSLSKRERNRISAKQSRDRKKLYIELMEHEQKKLEKQLDEVGKEIEETKTKINKFCSQNKATVGFAMRNQLESKLQSKVEEGKQDQINMMLDCISFRIGAIGRERVQKQNECYKQIINLSLPALHRYLMWAATEGKHVFSEKEYSASENQEFPCPLYQNIQNTADYDVIHSNFMQVKTDIVNRKQELLQLITKLWTTKENVEQSLKKLQDEINLIREVMSPIQVAKFILFAGRNKYRNSLNFFQEDKEYKTEQEMVDKISKPIKKVKREQQQQ